MASKHNKHFQQRNILVMLIVVFGFVLILPKVPSFSESITTLRNADFVYVLAGILWWISTFCTAALVYVCLSKRALPYGRTVLVQVAGGFANRFAPSGTGAIATSIRYLVKQGNSVTQASTIVAINNILGFIGTVLLLSGLILWHKEPMSHYFRPTMHISVQWILLAAVFLIVSAGLLLLNRKKIFKVGSNIWKTTKGIVRNPVRLIAALLASIAITLGYALTLYSIGMAFNVHIHAVQILLVMTLGVAAASVTPTPGGIGGAELGLTAALIAVGVTSHQAITVAFTYRLITYWLALVPGFIGLQTVLRKKYI